MAIPTLFCFIALSTVVVAASLDSEQDQKRRELGKNKLHTLQEKAQSNTCWREAVARLNSTCKKLSDTEQSRLAVAFANCHLAKSGRVTYQCNDLMTVQECTEGMDDVAFQTYTEFFTHTGHICFFLQNELWQEHNNIVISKLSETSAEAVEKLEQSLDYHREMEKKQNQALHNQEDILEQGQGIATTLDETKGKMEESFAHMDEMAQKQKRLLAEMFGTLQGSIEGVRYLMSLFLIEFIGYETFAVFVVSCLVILFLPQFGYSRFKLYLLLFVELAVEILVRRLFGYFVLWGGGTRPPPESMETLHSWLWTCRYLAFVLVIILYVREWLTFKDHTHLLTDIQHNTDLIMSRLGIESPQDTRRQPSASTVPPPQGGPPPPTSISQSLTLENTAQNGVVPNGFQPAELTSRGNPSVAEDSIGGGMFSKGSADKPGPIARGGGSGEQRTPYHFDPIPGLAPPIGHPLSPYTDQRISQYIAGLPARFDSPGDLSFASTTANPPDSDKSDDTIILSESESPFVRQPLKRSPVNKRSKSGGGGASGPGGVGGRVPVPSNDSLLNVSPGNRLRDCAEPEKEVSEEKEVISDMNSSVSSVRWRERSRRTEPLAPPSPRTPHTPRRRTLQVHTSLDTPHRYNLRSRTPKPSNK